MGVSSAGFSGMQIGSMTQIFVPITMQPLLVPRAQSGNVSLLDSPLSWWLQILVRLRTDVPEARAQAAKGSQILTMILREVSWMAAAGVALGVGGAGWLTRFVSTMLYGLSPTDPPTLISVAVLLILVALLARFGPARRASRVDPTRALRHE